MSHQLTLSDWAATSPQPEPAPEPESVPAVRQICPAKKPKPVPVPTGSGKFSPGEIVIISQPGSWNFFAAGTVVDYTIAGMVRVNIGVPDNPYTCSEERLSAYDGVITLWRLGAAASCDRPDCTPKLQAKPFTCPTCDRRAGPWWWYVGDMSIKPTEPRWPDAMWFPAGYDPNSRENSSQQKAGPGKPDPA